MDRRELLKLLGLGVTTLASVPALMSQKTTADSKSNNGVRGLLENVKRVPIHDVTIKFKDPEYEYKLDRSTPTVRPSASGRADLSSVTVSGDFGEVDFVVNAGSCEWSSHREFEYQFQRGHLDSVIPTDQMTDVSLHFQFESVNHRDWQEVIRKSETLSVSINTGDAIYLFDDFRWDTFERDLGQAHVSITGRCSV